MWAFSFCYRQSGSSCLLSISIPLVSAPGDLVYLWRCCGPAFLQAGTLFSSPYISAGC